MRPRDHHLIPASDLHRGYSMRSALCGIPATWQSPCTERNAVPASHHRAMLQPPARPFYGVIAMTIRPLALMIAAALFPAGAALAQDPPRPDGQHGELRALDTVIATGTRVSDRTVAESQSPIDIITPEVLQATGTLELA